MPRALFLGLPLHGHVPPSLPLVRALVDRGEEVVYVSSDVFADRVRQAGATHLTYRAPALADLKPMSERTEQIAWFLMQAVQDVLVHDMEGFRAARPDYVITDSVAPWGQWVAQLLGVPVVTSVATLAINRHVLAFAASRGSRPKSVPLAFSKITHVIKAAALGRRLRRTYGVQGTGIMGLIAGRSDLNIVYTSREFQPCADSFDDRFLFIGPSIGLRRESDGSPGEEVAAMGVTYISLGTLFNADPAFYRICFDAFRDQDVPVLMSVGSSVPADSLGTPPANVTVTPWVPQLDVLQRAAVFVSHGGMNSVSESLYHGVPMVVVPQMGEQEVIAKQVAALGAGLFLDKKDVTADRLREAVDRVRRDGSFRERAAHIGRSFEPAGGAVRGAEAILAYIAAGRAPVSAGSPRRSKS
jgi:MGT family glycosyltransferase